MVGETGNGGVQDTALKIWHRIPDCEMNAEIGRRGSMGKVTPGEPPGLPTHPTQKQEPTLAKQTRNFSTSHLGGGYGSGG